MQEPLLTGGAPVTDVVFDAARKAYNATSCDNTCFDAGVRTPDWARDAKAAEDWLIAPKAESTFTNKSGLRIHYRKKLPDREGGLVSPPAVVLFVHGIGAHANKHCFSLQGEACAAAGLAWYGLDHQAHGYSEGHGERVIHSVHDLVDDVLQLIADVILQDLGESCRVYLCGLSLGGAISVMAALRMQEEGHPLHDNFGGCYLVSPAIVARLPPQPVKLLLMGLAPLLPNLTALSPPPPATKGSPIAPGGGHASQDCYELDHLDPMAWSGRLKLRTGAALVEMLTYVQKHAPRLAAPFRIIHGAQDAICLPAGSRMMDERSAFARAERAAGRPSPVLILDGYRHALLADWCAETCVADLVGWVQQRQSAPPAPQPAGGAGATRRTSRARTSSISDHAPCLCALSEVLHGVQRAEASLDSLAAKAADGERPSRELAAARAQVKELKGSVKLAQAALAHSSDAERSLPRLALWAGVLCALYASFVALWELQGRDAPEAYADDCLGLSSLTSFVVVMCVVWLASYICRTRLLPLWQPRTHVLMPQAKRDKALGYAIKASGRLLVFLALSTLLSFWTWSGLELGHDAEGNACAGWHGTRRRTWSTSKTFFLVMMVWELCFMPEMGWDVWLHHISLIAGVMFSTDHRLSDSLVGVAEPASGYDIGPPAAKTALDGFAFILMYGTAFMFAKEAFVLQFQHRSLRNTFRQYQDLRLAAAVHLVGQGAFYLAWPAAYVAVAFPTDVLPLFMKVVLIVILVLLNVLEGYIFSITWKVMQGRKKKLAASRRARVGTSSRHSINGQRTG